MNLIRRTMQAFLNETRNPSELAKRSKLCIVLGNEACDLDSAVCAVSLAFYYHVVQNDLQCSYLQSCVKTRLYVPVLNIRRDDYILKTEVDFTFNKYGVSAEMLTFVDDLADDALKKSEIILVDHHASPFVERCIEVFDHRPIDQSVEFPKNCKVHIEQVGSCATLVAEKLLLARVENDYIRAVCGFAVLSLLRNAIILDTVNFNESAKRAKPKDIEICEELEKAIEAAAERPIEPRKILYTDLIEARSDVDSLTPLQILRKDLKFLVHQESGTKVALSGFPITIKSFLLKENADLAIQEFADKYKLSVIILISLAITETDEGERVDRELGIINVKSMELYDAIVARLRKNPIIDLKLQRSDDIVAHHGEFFKQNNLTATRKHITPIVQGVLDEWWAPLGAEEEEG